MQLQFLAIIIIITDHSLRNVLGGDKLALLSATLRTYQKTACYNDQIIISCPRGTSIAIEFAQYNKFVVKDGIAVEDICQPVSNVKRNSTEKSKNFFRGSSFESLSSDLNGTLENLTKSKAINFGETVNISTPLTKNETSSESKHFEDNKIENCLWPNALQYSLLQTVVETCQKKKYCKFVGAPHYFKSALGLIGANISEQNPIMLNLNGLPDLCLKQQNIVEIGYKCRPYEFRSKVACHNDVAQLHCNPYSRIAIYSASFGRTEYESIQCPQPQGVREETCLASHATEIIMQICHGRRRCNIAADANTFGTPCQQNSRMYLKVVYACVPKQVLQNHYESEIEQDEKKYSEDNFNDVYDDDLNYKESEAETKLFGNTSSNNDSSKNITAYFGANEVTNKTDTLSVHTKLHASHYYNDGSLEDEQAIFYISLIVAGSFSILLSFVVILIRVLLNRDQSNTSDSSSDKKTDSELKNGANLNDIKFSDSLIEENKERRVLNYNESALTNDSQKQKSSPVLLPNAISVVLYNQTTDLAASSYKSSNKDDHSNTIEICPYVFDNKYLYPPNCDSFTKPLAYCTSELDRIPVHAEIPDQIRVSNFTLTMPITDTLDTQFLSPTKMRDQINNTVFSSGIYPVMSAKKPV